MALYSRGPGLALASALEVTVEAGTADAQDLCSAHAVPLAHLKHPLDVHAAHLFERQRAPGLARRVGAPHRLLQELGEVADVDELVDPGDTSAGNYVFQLAHVPGPGMLEQYGLRAARQPLDAFAIGLVVLLQKILHQDGDILEPLGEAGNADLDGA